VKLTIKYYFWAKSVQIIHKIFEIKNHSSIEIQNVTFLIEKFLNQTASANGQVLVFSRHTTTAIAINEDEERLLEDLKVYLKKLAPPTDKYLHNDLHLRKNLPPNEPINAHSHLLAMTLSTSEVIPIIDGKLALGTWQEILFCELDGPRNRTLLVQISGIKNND
jgi:secondary thiamine-phosphate synthase enzyme